MGVYWKEAEFTVTSPRVTIPQYMELSEKQGVSSRRVIEILVGDYQRISVYAEKGYQVKQPRSPEAEAAFRTLCGLGYTGQLVK